MTQIEQIKAEIQKQTNDIVGGKGDCHNRPHLSPFRNYCYYYKIYLVAPGFEATCTFNKEEADKYSYEGYGNYIKIHDLL